MYKCERGTYALNYNQITCDICEAGDMCDGEQKSACPTYKYSYSGWGYCLFAPAGYYLKIDQTEIYQCASGTYAIYGSGDSAQGAATCQTCPVGHSCADAWMVPQPCSPGEYQPSTGQASCLSCGSGAYSLFGESECHTSPAGYSLTSSS